MIKFEITICRGHVYALMGLVLAIALVAPAAVWASDRSQDVPDSNVFHDDISWLADNGVTLGCNPPNIDLFCPQDVVRRDTMATFMRRPAVNQVVDAAAVQGLEPEDLMSGSRHQMDEM